MLPYVLLYASVGLLAAAASLNPPWRAPGIVAMMLLVLFAGARGDSVDYYDYTVLFDLLKDASDIPWYARILIGKDPLFGTLMLAVASVGASVQWVFLSSAAISIGFKWRALERAFGSAALPLLVVLSTYFFSHEFTQIRAGLALSFAFMSLLAWNDDHPKAAIAWGLVATGFHASALILLALIPAARGRWAPWTVTAIVAAMLAIARIAFRVLGDVDERIGMQLEQTGTSVIPIIIATLKLPLLAWITHVTRPRCPDHSTLLRTSFILCAAGVPMLIGFRDLSSAAAFRFYELLDAFCVFPISAAFLRGPVLAWAAAFVVCFVTWLPLVLGGLLPEYKLGTF